MTLDGSWKGSISFRSVREDRLVRALRIMRGLSSFPKPFLTILAVLFAATTILYSGRWVYFQHWQVPVQLGFDNE
jgi:hypothetical protein